jgi:N-acetyl-1-D-myo-inositol-2-amino-2-deoxy-alpha-D-glucopyranoside deacetylase
MRALLVCLAAAITWSVAASEEQATPKTLAVVIAHPDDEGAASPMLARYGREGVAVYLIIATDGAAGSKQTSVPPGVELARVRAEEARCATDALGLKPPVLLGFPDGQLGNYAEDPLRLFRLTQRLHEELQRLRPDALITWGPDGGTGHPDHRLVGAIVAQLVRTGAPGVPDRVFYMSLPAEVMRAVNPARGAPPLLVPQAKHLITRVPFSPVDLEAARRSLSCHKTQFPPETMMQIAEAAKQAWNGVIPLAPASGSGPERDVFQ